MLRELQINVRGISFFLFLKVLNFSRLDVSQQIMKTISRCHNRPRSVAALEAKREARLRIHQLSFLTLPCTNCAFLF